MKNEKRLRIFVLTALLILAGVGVAIAVQQVTFTALYPAPFGEYLGLVVGIADHGALRFSPSTAGVNVDPELVVQSAATDVATSQDSPFHISRNARFDTADDLYHYIDIGGEVASKIEFEADGDIKFSSAPLGVGPAAIPAASWTDHLFIDRANNRVGIGTTTPLQQLDVAGLILSNDSIQMNRVGSNPFALLTKGGTNAGEIIGETAPDLRISIADTTGPTSFLSVITGGVSSGRVGIGTTSPQSTFHVAGSGYFQLDTTAAVPPAVDCDVLAEVGRMKFNTVNNKLYICDLDGVVPVWKSVLLAP